MRLVAAAFTVLLAVLLLATVGNAETSTRPECIKHPALATAEGAYERAQRGWDSDKVKKRPSVINRVRIQSRCAPTKEGRKFVKDAIAKAKAHYKKAKKQALYDELTSEPGQKRLYKLRVCESGDRYGIAPGGAYGMLQGWAASLPYYKKSGWPGAKNPSPTPYSAGKKEQDIRASLLYQHGGWWECPF